MSINFIFVHPLFMTYTSIIRTRMTRILEKRKRGKEQESQARTMEKVNESLLLLLPTDVIIHILVRLPVYSVFSCKCVCKKLKEILSDPYFVENRFAKTPGSDSYLVIQDFYSPSNIVLASMFDLDKPALYSNTKSIGPYGDGGCHSWQTLTPPFSIPKTELYFMLIGSCNGLLLFLHNVHEDVFYYVCNPVLGEFTILPQAKLHKDFELAGFGFCPKTNQYKVLRFFSNIWNGEILTLGTSKWRKINDLPKNKYVHQSFFDSSYHGNFHWICDTKSEKSICYFDLEREQCLYMSLPACFERKTYNKFHHKCLGTLDGLFCVSYTRLPGYFEVYVMEDYGVKESWIKKVSIDVRHHFDYRDLNIIRFLDNGALVVRSPSSQSSMVYYDTRKGRTSDVDDIDKQGCCSVVAHVPSLISLNDIVGNQNVERGERKMMHFFSSKARIHRR